LKILLDENLDWRLRRDLPGHTVESVPLLGWSGLKNGALLARAEEHQFDVLLTMDTNLAFQQDLSKFKIIVISLRARSNRLADTRPLMPKVSKLLATVKPGALIVVTP
jgi:predicted nuclease of predicted toxin-antitoxin system